MYFKYYYEPEHDIANMEGKHDLVFNLATPFELLPYCYADVKLKAEKHSYAWNLTVEIKNSSVEMDGTLEVRRFVII